MLPLAILTVAAVAAYAIAWRRGGPDLLMQGVGEALSLFGTVAPQLIVGFLLAGMLTFLLPTDVIAAWLGADSGLRGILIATVAGALTPGGPFLQFPLVASLAKAGAGPGPLSAYLAAWSLVGMNRFIVWELPLLGPHFALVRWVVSLTAPIIAGLAVPVILRLVTREG